MMKKNRFWSILLLTLLLSLTGTKAFAQDIAVENDDGITIYYKYINNGTELEVMSGISKYSGVVVIPEEVTYMNRTRKVTSIHANAFYECPGLTSVTIPNSVTTIGNSAFYKCSALTSIDIPNSVTTIGDKAFMYCSALASVTIGNSVTSIGDHAFYECPGLQKVIVKDIAAWCGISFGEHYSNPLIYANHLYSDENTEITNLVIPKSVTSIGKRAFSGVDLPTVVSLIEEPFAISGKSSNSKTFTINTFNNATLYVPAGTIAKYKATQGWRDFLFIEEGTGPGGETPEPQKCEKPSISYKNGKLTFSSTTEGALCQYTITDEDIRTGISNEVQLGVTYRISVYATKAGLNDSDVATATLCWIDSNPKSEGLENGVANIPAQAILIQSHNGQLTIEGAEEGTAISIYDTAGRMVGSARASAETTNVSTTLHSGDIGIVKIGEKAVKVQIR